MVGPKLKVQGGDSQPATNGAIQAILKYKKYIIIAVLVIIAGGAVYYGINKYFSKPLEQDILIKTTTRTNTTTPEQTSTQANNELVKTPQWKEWLIKYFNAEACSEDKVCGPDADPENDGLQNHDEFALGTDPNNKDSDQDGISDGDEANVFLSNALQSHTARDPQYNDADFIKGAYNIANPSQKYTPTELKALTDRMKAFGLHQPTVKTISTAILESVYGYTEATSTEENAATTTPDSKKSVSANVDQSAEAKQDRDTQRSTTMKSISVALVKYFDDRHAYPSASSFMDMVDQIKPYNRVAVNPVDPINQDPYLFSYGLSEDKSDFVLAFYSETQNQIIKIRSADGRKYLNSETAAQFDEQRKNDLEMIRSALLLYSSANAAGNQDYVFPVESKYKTEIVPKYLTTLPKEPKTSQDYEYKVAGNFDAFTLKSPLDAPPSGYSGYLCNQEECRYY